MLSMRLYGGGRSAPHSGGGDVDQYERPSVVARQGIFNCGLVLFLDFGPVGWRR